MSGHRFQLGTIDEVITRDCPFCGLVTSAVFSLYHNFETIDEIDGSKLVTLSWDRSLGMEGFELRKVMISSDTLICFEHGTVPDDIGFLPVTAPEIDPSLLKSWLSTCRKVHGDQCSPIIKDASPASQQLLWSHPFRFVDVQANCVVDAVTLPPYPREFFALSYVWGQVPTAKLTRSNLRALMRQNGLSSVWEMLPKTITDAIDLAKSLEINYLWIDAICIVQDDETDMKDGIRKMDLIYEQAVATIIAAAGPDANSGLPGVQSNSRRCTQATAEVIPGVRMMVRHVLDRLLSNCEYTRRAWT